MRNKRLWRLMWQRYWPAVIIFALVTVLITGFILHYASRLTDVPMSRATYLYEMAKHPGQYDRNYVGYLHDVYAPYVQVRASDPIPSSNGGVVLSVLMLLTALIAGIVCASRDLRSGFLVFCQQAGFSRQTVLRVRGLFLAATFSVLTVLHMLFMLAVDYHVHPDFITIKPGQIVLVLLYNVVWVGGVSLAAQAIATMVGRGLFATVLLWSIGIMSVAAFSNSVYILPFSNVTLDNPGDDYWPALLVGLVLLGLSVWALAYAARHVQFELINANFTMRGAKTRLFVVLAVMIAIATNAQVGTASIDYTGLAMSIMWIVFAGIMWFGGDYLTRRIGLK
ncbi:hypothetical protein [Lacticaseibacillus sharpeae]|nr:hypothetical protein [Lacticaseibacillus sharpeae]